MTEQNERHDPFDIYIVGTGISPLHLTREVEFTLRRSKKVFFVDKAFGIEACLRECCSDVVDLHPLCYREGSERMDAYQSMATYVIEGALAQPPVAFALYGHPLIYAFPPFLVLAAARVLGLRVKVLPGVSALDTLFADLRFDPATEGLQMYEATDLLLRERPIQTDVPCLLWQVGAVESRLYSARTNQGNRFTRLRDYLLRFYPPTHPLTAVHSATVPLAPSLIEQFPLGQLEQYAENIHQGVTVFLPPVSHRPISNTRLMDAMDDKGHLFEITKA